ncbi:hypothetical protein F4803DRAFT_16086 [Xylaria telfairii]|nr:hypothetical protein F4803DRAFT_16086 [Xylaria telfairii]
MYFPTLGALLIAIQAACIYALPPKVQPTGDIELLSFIPSEPISGWPTTTTVPAPTLGTPDFPVPVIPIPTTRVVTDDSTLWTPVITTTTITVTDNSINWTPTQPISGWPPASSNTQTSPGQQLTEIFTIIYTSFSKQTVSLPPPSAVTSSISQSQTPAFTIVTVTASQTPLASTPTGPFTVITVTASPTTPPLGPGQITTTPRFVTITVSEVTIWPTQTTKHTSQLVTLTLTSSSVNESLNSTSVSYSSTVLTLSPPPTSATGTATVGFVSKKHV